MMVFKSPFRGKRNKLTILGRKTSSWRFVVKVLQTMRTRLRVKEARSCTLCIPTAQLVSCNHRIDLYGLEQGG